MVNTFSFDEIGLSNRDKRVYEALSAWPQSSLRTLAEETGINRGSVYESIKTLLRAGLVSSQVGKQHRYIAASPDTIIELLKERQLQASRAQQAAETYIRSLTPQTKDTPIPFGAYYEDYAGIATILRDVIATCRTNNGKSYRVISTGRVREFIYENFRNFTQRRIAANISVRVIGVGAPGGKDALSERRTLPAHRGSSPNCYTLIYGDKTAFINLDERNILSAVVIDNPGITHLQKELFDQQWDNLAA